MGFSTSCEEDKKDVEIEELRAQVERLRRRGKEASPDDSNGPVREEELTRTGAWTWKRKPRVDRRNGYRGNCGMSRGSLINRRNLRVALKRMCSDSCKRLSKKARPSAGAKEVTEDTEYPG